VLKESVVRRKLRWIVAVALAVLTSLALVWVVRARRAVEEARADAAHSPISFEIRPLSASRPNTVDYLPAPPDFRDAQIFHDSLYIAGAGGLWVYDLAGNLRTSYQVGRDLPASPLVAMAVGTVAGDAEPKLWIATSGAGILSFDGERFSQILVHAKDYGNANSLLILPTGILLIGFSEGGVVRYDGAMLAPFHPDLRKVQVTALAGSEGDLWIGTRDRGVIHWQAGSTEEFQDQPALPDNHVLSIAAAGERLFVGTPVGAEEFRGGKPFQKIADGVFSQSLLATKNHLLVGTVDEGVVEIKLAADRPGRFISADSTEPRAARRLLEFDGRLFALTSDGLFEQESGAAGWTRRIEAPRPHWTDRNISALSVDPAGKLWIGYFDRGIDIADMDGGENAMHVEDDQIFCVNRIVQDSNRNMSVVATANGIALMSPQGKILKRITEADGLISQHVSDVVVRPDGLAVATAAGVTLLDAGGPESIYAFHGLANNHVYSLASSGSRLMAGTLGGLSVIQDGFVRASYTASNSRLKQNWISAVVPLGDSWLIGTYGGGVVQLDPGGQWRDFPDFPAQTVVNPNAMLAVSNRVLAGTLDRGLFVYSAAEHRWTPVTDGLPSLNVTALAASSTNVFIGTDNGIVRMPIERLPQ
jgi:ligand-binding sensor domain-containing protein